MVYNFLKENIVSSYYNFSNNDDLNNFDFTSSKKYNFIQKNLVLYKNLLNQLMSFKFFFFFIFCFLDLRICNCDRNEENILVIKKKIKKMGKIIIN